MQNTLATTNIQQLLFLVGTPNFTRQFTLALGEKDGGGKKREGKEGKKSVCGQSGLRTRGSSSAATPHPILHADAVLPVHI